MVILAGPGLACHRGLPPEGGVTRLRAAYTSAVDVGDIPSLLAHRSLEQDGYRVEPTFFAQPELAVEALARGDADVANGGVGAFWAADAKGADLVMVMEHSENGYQLAVVSGVAGCDDLTGRTLALASRGSLPTALGEAYLLRCPAAKPRVIVMPRSGDRLSALRARAVDAAVLQRADVARLEHEAPGQFRMLASFRDVFPDLAFEGVFVTRRLLSKHRRLVVDYVRERIRANRRVLANPDLLYEEGRRWPAMGTLDAAVVAGEIGAPAWTHDGGMIPDRIAATLDFFVRIGHLPSSLTTGRLADFSVVKDALHAAEAEEDDLAAVTDEQR
jgi:ABC-type nitrate/sulfonate/bicarbonate transport system substrate-binding protein